MRASRRRRANRRCRGTWPPLRRFRAQAAAAGVKSIRLHDLRHTHATLLLLAGVSPKAVQDRLGHKTIQVTMDLYNHVVPALQDLAAAAVDVLLNGPIGGGSGEVVTNS